MQRRAGMTVWRQIVEHLTATIRDHIRAPGEKLPPEAELARQYGVNRHTVRRALEELARARLIEIEHGRGSFVTEPVLDYQLNRRPRFSEWVRRHNQEPKGEAIRLGSVVLSTVAEAEMIAEALDLTPNDRVIELERLGKADRRPVALARHFFPAALPGLLSALEQHTSITAALTCVGVTDYVRKRSRISSRMPSPREAMLLKIGDDVPVLYCENVNITTVGAPLEICFVIYPSNRVQLIVEPGADDEI